MDRFSNPTRHWFDQAFEAPTPVQQLGWERIAEGDHSLLIAPTGSGKTLAAFLWAIDRLSREQPEELGVRVVYVSPLKALVYDIERNLRAPLAGIERAAAALGESIHIPTVDVRTGDTPQRDRRRQARTPGEILVTTPESLFLILGSAASENLRTAKWVIVDEVHAMAPTKRGSHLAVSLERLSHLADADPQRIGLSATARPAAEVARFLGGDRSVEVVDTHVPPDLDLRIVVPVEDMGALGEVVEEPDGLTIPGVWARRRPPASPVTLDPVDDHRLAMSFAILGLRRPGISVSDAGVVAKSYPGFWRDFETVFMP